jgi:hypothetical protein
LNVYVIEAQILPQEGFIRQEIAVSVSNIPKPVVRQMLGGYPVSS